MNRHRELFIQNGMPFDELDEELVEILFLLNFKLNIKTKFSCAGHGDKASFYIMFDESEPFDKMEKFVELTSKTIKCNDIMIKYWIRYFNKKKVFAKNWILESNGSKDEKTRRRIRRELTTFLKNMVKNKSLHETIAY